MTRSLGLAAGFKVAEDDPWPPGRLARSAEMTRSPAWPPSPGSPGWTARSACPPSPGSPGWTARSACPPSPGSPR